MTDVNDSPSTTDEDTCPCSYPEGWDACPVHRDGAPADNTSQV